MSSSVSSSVEAIEPKGLRLILPLCAAFAARMVALPFAHISHPNLWEYGTIARCMISGQGYSFVWTALGIVSKPYPTAFMPPGETFIQLTGMSLFGDNVAGYVAIFVFHALCGVGFVYYSGKIVSKIFHNNRLTALTLWLAALYPSFVFATATFGVAAPVLFLNALFIWSSLRFAERLQTGERLAQSAMLLGFASGLLGFFRAEAPVLIGCTLVLILIEKRNVLRLWVMPILLALGIYIAMQSPWTIRNYQVFHQVIIGSASGPFNLWRGNSDIATGGSYDAYGGAVQTTDAMWRDLMPTGSFDSTIEKRFFAYHMAVAKKWMSDHPMRMVLLDLKKVVMLWGIDWYSDLGARWEYISMYALTAIVTVFGLFRLKHIVVPSFEPLGLHLVALWSVIYSLITMVFFSLSRFQIFLVALYLPLFALGLEAIIAQVLRWRPAFTLKDGVQPQVEATSKVYV
jgi:hypothetical protein